MALRAKKPEPTSKRLKLFMYSTAGVGKTTAAIQFPNAYIIDCEKGTENYDKIISASGSVVFQTTEMSEVIEEVRELLRGRHEYRTLVIDPITTVYNDLLDRCAEKVGEDFGRHYGAANKEMKRLANLIMALDMNVVVTAHAKAEYGANLAKLGYTFDGWKQLDYWFDLVIELGKKGKKRFGKVVKTRLESFPDEDIFEWSYDAIQKRCDPETLGRNAAGVDLATPEQIADLLRVIPDARLPEGTTDKWFAKAGVDCWDDMPASVVEKCLEFAKARITKNTEPVAAPSEEEFIVELDMTLDNRGIVGDGAAKAKRKILSVAKVSDLAEIKPAWREALLKAVNAGKYDEFKTNGTAVTA